MDKITSSTILQWFKEAVEEKRDLDTNLWVDAAHKLVIFLGDEEQKLYELQQQVAEKKLEFYDAMDKPVVATAEMKVEATDIFKEFKQQKARVNQIEEFIRIAKLRAKVSSGGF